MRPNGVDGSNNVFGIDSSYGTERPKNDPGNHDGLHGHSKFLKTLGPGAGYGLAHNAFGDVPDSDSYGSYGDEAIRYGGKKGGCGGNEGPGGSDDPYGAHVPDDMSSDGYGDSSSTNPQFAALVQALQALAKALEGFAGGSRATDSYGDPGTNPYGDRAGSSPSEILNPTSEYADPMTGGAPQPGQPGAAPRPGEPGAAPRPGEPGSGTEGMYGGSTGGMAQIIQILGMLIPLITQLIQRLSGGNAGGGGDPSVPGMLPDMTGGEAAPIAGAEGQEGV